MDQSGNAIVAWQALDTVHIVRYQPASGFSGLVDINGLATWGSPTYIASVAANSGNLMVLVDQGSANGDPPVVTARVYDARRGWLEQAYAGSLRWPPSALSLRRSTSALLPNGRALAMWTDSDGRDDVYANVYDPEIGWGRAGSLSRGTGSLGAWTQFFQIQGTANATAVWLGWPDFYGNEYETGRGWALAEPIPPFWRDSGLLSGARDGRFYGLGVGGSSASISKYTRGAGWGAHLVLESHPDPSWSPVAVLEGEDDSWLALWTTSNEPGCDANIWSSEGTAADWSKPALFDSHAASPVAAKSGAGAAAVAWLGTKALPDSVNGSCGASRSVHLRRFGQAEPLELDRVEAPGYARDLALEMMPDGNALVAWTRVADGLTPEIRVRLIAP